MHLLQLVSGCGWRSGSDALYVSELLFACHWLFLAPTQGRTWGDAWPVPLHVALRRLSACTSRGRARATHTPSLASSTSATAWYAPAAVPAAVPAALPAAAPAAHLQAQQAVEQREYGRQGCCSFKHVFHAPRCMQGAVRAVEDDNKPEVDGVQLNVSAAGCSAHTLCATASLEPQLAPRLSSRWLDGIFTSPVNPTSPSFLADPACRCATARLTSATSSRAAGVAAATAAVTAAPAWVAAWPPAWLAWPCRRWALQAWAAWQVGSGSTQAGIGKTVYTAGWQLAWSAACPALWCCSHQVLKWIPFPACAAGMGGMGMMMGNSLVQLVPVQLPNGQVRQQGEVWQAGGPGAAAPAAHEPCLEAGKQRCGAHLHLPV